MFVIGDIHGRYEGLVQVLERSNFDPKSDVLVILGDVCDGGKDTRKCIDLLLGIRHRIMIRGNHDEWTLGWFLYGKRPKIWTEQGGNATIKSYGGKRENVPESHISFLKESIMYFVDNYNRIYVHGGFDPDRSLHEQSNHTFMWNRDIIEYAYRKMIPNFTHVFIGHTKTQLVAGKLTYSTPITFNNLTMLDTGAGWYGKLTIMDTDTFKYYQSDLQKP